MAVGTAASLLLMQPKTLPELVLGTGVAAIGSVISDIDIGTSGSRKELNKILCLLAAAVAMTIAAEYIWNIGIYQKLMMKYSSNTRMYGSIIIFAVICIFGMATPHRSFMHSMLAGFLLCSCVEVFLPLMVPYFAVAYCSHLVLDGLNKKPERLLYPIGKGLCLRICSSRGIVNKLLFVVGSMLSLGTFVYYVVLILK